MCRELVKLQARNREKKNVIREQKKTLIATKRCIDVYTQTNRDATIFVHNKNGQEQKKRGEQNLIDAMQGLSNYSKKNCKTKKLFTRVNVEGGEKGVKKHCIA